MRIIENGIVVHTNIMLQKKRYEFKKELGRWFDVPQYIKEKI